MLKILFYFFISFFIFPSFAFPEVFQGLYCWNKEENITVDCHSGKILKEEEVYSNYRKIKKGRIIEDIKFKYPLCTNLNEDISDAYRYPAIDRDDLFIEKLVNEIKQLGGRDLDAILNEIYDESVEFKMINDKSPVGWKMHNGGRIPRGTIINFLQEEKDKLSHTKPTASTPVPKEVLKFKHGSLSAKIGVEFPNGWLIGDHNGEFSGHLVFIHNNKSFQVLLHDNIYGIYNSPIGWVAITGMRHMMTNESSIYKISNTGGKWAAHEYANLYAAPDDHFQLKDGSVLISNDWGAFHLTKNGLCRLVKEP